MSSQLFEEEAPQANTPRNGRGSRSATVEAPPPPAPEAPVLDAPLREEIPLVEAVEAPPVAPSSAPAPKPVVEKAVVAGPRVLPDDRNSVTHAFRASGVEGLAVVGLFDDGAPGEVLLVLRRAPDAVGEALNAFTDALNLALPYGVPLAACARSLVRLAPAGDARAAIETLVGYLESKFSG